MAISSQKAGLAVHIFLPDDDDFHLAFLPVFGYLVGRTGSHHRVPDPAQRGSPGSEHLRRKRHRQRERGEHHNHLSQFHKRLPLSSIRFMA